jgi:hypothetical protein
VPKLQAVGCYWIRTPADAPDMVAKVENRTTQKLVKIDLQTTLSLRRFSTPLRRRVIDFA